ncbi:MAG: NAD(P)/FAD-dependent oxidoreductase [Butyrivibrio sp.]|nr:NAD(P)/FAD-dependent oxidoreductase [Acetatifactor muris]MCM1559805.1 NAD(P)/FAD-dependent oxidoreductase [Butyrivibrio sp.]
MKKELVIIGGGPAGLAAAIAAKENGVDDLVILERDGRLGGILNQCIHNGFGLHTFKEELTGPEYAGRYIDKALELGIPYKLNTMVADLTLASENAEAGSEGSAPIKTPGEAEDKSVDAQGGVKLVTVMNRQEGLYTIEAKAVILAMGCRERSRGALNIPGYRPAGIYSAGTAQRYVNMEGRMPGKEVVILGSGDIGLIMARRMTLEGARVKLVAELMPYSGGLKRNIVQCLDDFGIPLKLSHTVVDIKGKERVEAVVVAQVDENSRPIPGTEEEIPCDTLLLSCGLIPENELSGNLGVEMNPVTNGPRVNESLETDKEGVFACGNVLHVHDLVDYVSEEAAQAGKRAAAYLQGRLPEARPGAAKGAGGQIPIRAVDGVRYTVPASLDPRRMEETQVVRFRVGNVYRDAAVEVSFNGKVVSSRKKKALAPGEMEQVILKRADLEQFEGLEEITFAIRQG